MISPQKQLVVSRCLLPVALAAQLALSTLAGTTQPAAIETDFRSEHRVSSGELKQLAELAKMAGIQQIVRVATEEHMVGVSLVVAGDDQFEGHEVRFKTLRVYREGWPGPKRPGGSVHSVGPFWVDASEKPKEEKRWMMQVGKRSLRVGLEKGIEFEAAERVVKAFAAGKVRYASKALKEGMARLDLKSPCGLGTANGRPWISFTSIPGKQVFYRLTGDEATVIDSAYTVE